MNSRTLIVTACLVMAACVTSTSGAQSTTQVDLPGEDRSSTIISRDVLVASGDTLASIAERELGRAGFAPQLAEFNGLIADAPLIPGNIIRIPIHVPARGEFARVIFAKGSVRANRLDAQAVSLAVSGQADVPRPISVELTRNSEILSGDTVVTGPDGYVSVEFSSGSVVNMQPDSEATLSRLNCLPTDDSCVIEINTTRGKVTSDVETRDDQPVDFRINTPYASAAVRGTVFDVDAGEVLRVGVTDGDVGLSAQEQTVALETGFGSVVEQGQAPSEPVPLLPPPVFKRVPARIALEDAVTWWPFTGAEEYAALLALDEDGNEALANYSVTADRIGFEGVESGDYFLHLRAIDEYGLLGFTSNTRITIADIDNSIAPVSTSVVRQGSEFLVEVQDPPLIASGFEIQIADNADFEDPLSVDVNANGTAVFRLDNDQVYTRARVLLDPYTVSAYGDISSSDD